MEGFCRAVGGPNEPGWRLMIEVAFEGVAKSPAGGCEVVARRPDGPPGHRRPERHDHVDGRPAIDQARFELALPDDLDHDAAGKAGRAVLRHLGPSVVLGELLLAGEHPQRPLVGLVSRGGQGSIGESRGRAATRRRL